MKKAIDRTIYNGVESWAVASLPSLDYEFYKSSSSAEHQLKKKNSITWGK